MQMNGAKSTATNTPSCATLTTAVMNWSLSRGMSEHVIENTDVELSNEAFEMYREHAQE